MICRTLSRAAALLFREYLLFFCLGSLPALAQVNQGELQLHVADSNGTGIAASIHLASQASQYDKKISTDAQGTLDVQHLPFGLYHVDIERSGFAPLARTVEIRSSIPVVQHFTLSLSAPQQTVTVKETLLDRDQPGSVDQIGTAAIQNRVESVPGRSVQDLVIT